MEAAHHFVQTNQSQLCYTRTEVAQIVQQLVYYAKHHFIRNQFFIELDDRSHFADRLELYTPI